MFTRLATHFGFSPTEALKIGTPATPNCSACPAPRDPYREAPVGVVQPGAWADVLLVNGDPTQDITLLADPKQNLAVIIKNGTIYKNQLSREL